ncbi:MAG: HEPN domain-containing protein [Acidimicrobiales bacterium]
MASYDAPELERWLRQAEAAMVAAAGATETPSWACFLYEQAAQLALKGLLHSVGEQEAAWGHDLVLLERRVAGIFGADWPAALAEPAARLGRHYIPARYPDAHVSGAPDEHYTSGDAEAATADARAALEAVEVVVGLLARAEEEHGHG